MRSHPPLAISWVSIPLLCALAYSLTGCGAGEKSAVGDSVSSGIDSTREPSDEAIRHYVAGSIHENAGSYALAIREYQAALSFDSSASIHAALARTYRFVHDPAAAVRYGTRAVALAPDNAAYREQLCEAFIANRQLDSAAAQYEILRRLEPARIEYDYVLARL